MIHLAQWISPELLPPLGLALLHFLWQGAALAALAALAMALARGASTRYVLGVIFLAAMVAAPAITFFVVRGQQPQTPAISAGTHAAASATPRHSAFRLNSRAAQPQPASEKPYLLLVEAWFLGVLLLSLRTAGGVVALERLRRRTSAPLSAVLIERCLALQRRMGLSRLIQYSQSIHLDAPAVIGWIRPVVLLPISALTGLSEAQLTAVLAHELAHIRRHDAFVNLFQVAAESLLFYHPAVWWLSKRIRTERENCCDDAAIAICGGPLEFARALTLMEEWRATPVLAMAANRAPLGDRIRRVLGVPSHASSMRAANLAAGVLCLSVALVAGNAFLGLARASVAVPRQSMPQATNAAKGDLLVVVQGTKPAPEEPSPAPAPESATPRQQSKPTPEPVPAPQPVPQAEVHESYIDALKAAGYANLSADELVGLKIQGITPDYIRAILAEDLKPTVDELIGLKIQGITQEYIQEMRVAGLKLNVDELIGIKIQGITPEYFRQMRELGLQADADNLIGMKVQGISADYVREMRAAGVKAGSDELIGMKVQGITTEYVKEMKDLGIQPDADGLIGMKVQGIAPEYIREIRATGINPDADELIGMKIQGVTPEYIKMLQAAGLKLDADDLITAKVSGITAEFIREVQSHGFKNLDIEKLIELKHSAVLDQ
jgi:beta-lactamase regulating signal transducer with metallopeptidase domain